MSSYTQVDLPDFSCENENGWGPSDPLPVLVALPLSGQFSTDYQFNIADWYNTRRRYHGNRRNDKGPANAEFSTLERKTDFNFVASEPKKKGGQRKGYASRQKQRAAWQYQRDNQKFRRDANKVETGARQFGGFAQAKRNKWQKRRNAQYRARQQGTRKWNDHQHKFEQCVTVLSTWGAKDDKWLPDMKEWLYELNEDSYGVETISEIGRARVFKKNITRVRADNPIKLKPLTKCSRKPWKSTMDDENLQVLEDQAEVFMTSEIMAALMACPASKTGWDMIVRKTEEGKLWFDLRPDTPLLRLQPDESVAKIIVKDIKMDKYLTSISQEAQLMDTRFGFFSLNKKTSVSGADGSTELPKTVMSNIARYKKFILSDYTIVSRCSFDAYDDEGETALICTTTQHHPGKSFNNINWHKELDVKFAAAKTACTNNNKYRFQRWAIEAVLGNVDNIMLGFVAREHLTNNKTHQCMKVLKMTSQEFAKSWCHLKSMENAWGVLDHLIQYLRDDEMQPGKYCILRDGNKDKLSFYKIDEHDLE